MTDVNQKSLDFHKLHAGKIHTALNSPITSQADLAIVYTPGVAAVSLHLANKPQDTNLYTSRGNTVAIVSDGSAVLGLGNIGPDGAWPVMEGKAALFSRFAGINAVPILLQTQDPKEIVRTITAIAPSFGGINLEDIKAPGCFYIEETLRETLSIPVIHDDQWGAATVTLAGLYNTLLVAKKMISNVKVVIVGAGAAAQATAKLLLSAGVKHLLLVDSVGIITSSRKDLDTYKQALALQTNLEKRTGGIAEAMVGADVCIGLSKPNVISKEMVQRMAKNPIIFALSNPTPEIMPDLAKEAGALIVATGRSDFANQLNNSLVFPGIFKGLLTSHKTKVTHQDFIVAAKALANMVTSPTTEKIIPTVFEDTASVIAKAFL